MKIAITGHTSGIGKAIADLYEQKGHTVVGFSRSTGFDISNPVSRSKIVEASQDCDVFFNNAYHDFSQCELLFELWDTWKGLHKTIVNMSSSQTIRWIHTYELKYRSSKRALEDSSEFLWNKSQWPNVIVAAPTLTDTPRAAGRNASNKVDPMEFAELLIEMLEKTNFRVQVLKLNVTPIPGQAGFSPETMDQSWSYAKMK